MSRHPPRQEPSLPEATRSRARRTAVGFRTRPVIGGGRRRRSGRDAAAVKEVSEVSEVSASLPQALNVGSSLVGS